MAGMTRAPNRAIAAAESPARSKGVMREPRHARAREGPCTGAVAADNPPMQNTRAHHTRMKYLLAQMALQDPAAFHARLGPGGDGLYLEHLWQGVGLQLAPEERVPAEGISTWHRPAAPGIADLLVLTLPRPERRNEAFFLAMRIAADRTCRLFCLESALDPMTQQTHTMLVEFVPRGRLNWGPGSTPERAAFVARIDELAQDAQARPNSFVELPLA